LIKKETKLSMSASLISVKGHSKKLYASWKYWEKKNRISFSSPIIEISSSLIRDNLKNKKSIKYMITDECRSYIEELSLYGISRNSK